MREHWRRKKRLCEWNEEVLSEDGNGGITLCLKFETSLVHCISLALWMRVKRPKSIGCATANHFTPLENRYYYCTKDEPY